MTPIPSACPLGVGNDYARLAAAIALGLGFLWFLLFGLQALVVLAIEEGWV